LVSLKSEATLWSCVSPKALKKMVLFGLALARKPYLRRFTVMVWRETASAEMTPHRPATRYLFPRGAVWYESPGTTMDTSVRKKGVDGEQYRPSGEQGAG
jgi:hypothetical protein